MFVGRVRMALTCATIALVGLGGRACDRVYGVYRNRCRAGTKVGIVVVESKESLAMGVVRDLGSEISDRVRSALHP